jgi:hypothetical protein
MYRWVRIAPSVIRRRRERTSGSWSSLGRVQVFVSRPDRDDKVWRVEVHNQKVRAFRVIGGVVVEPPVPAVAGLGSLTAWLLDRGLTDDDLIRI